MKKLVFFFGFLFLILDANSQKISGKLSFQQGDTIVIEVLLKTTIAQQAMGQAIDFNIDANASHFYKVINSTGDNTTLHHRVSRVGFTFDGMGQKKNFDSQKEKDLNGQFGKSIRDLLDKKFDIIIDTSGKVLAAIPEKVTLPESDSRMAIINSLLKDVIDLVHPPQKGSASFFKILPDTLAGIGDAWTSSKAVNGGKLDGAYKIAEITDSTVIIDFVENSATVIKAEMMGSATTTTMNHKSTGKITLDRRTGIIKEKKSVTESNGNTEGSFGVLPVTSKTTSTLTVQGEKTL